jgi:hypothetical protein
MASDSWGFGKKGPIILKNYVVFFSMLYNDC